MLVKQRDVLQNSATSISSQLSRNQFVRQEELDQVYTASRTIKQDDRDKFMERVNEIRQAQEKIEAEAPLIVSDDQDTESWYKWILKAPVSMALDFYQEKLNSLIRYGAMRSKQALKTLDDLKEMEQGVILSGMKDKELLLKEIALRRENIISSMINTTKITSYVLDKLPLSEIQGDEQGKRQLNTLVQNMKQQMTSIDRQIRTGISVDVVTSVSTSFDFLYDTAFGGSAGSSVSTTPYVGAEAEKLDDVNHMMENVQGKKIGFKGFASLDKDNCSFIAAETMRGKCYSFFDHIPREVKTLISSAKQSLRERAERTMERSKATLLTSEFNNSLLYLWLVPEYRAQLEKIEFSKEQFQELEDLMKENVSLAGGLVEYPIQGVGRVLKTISSKPQNWGNIFLLNFLSARVGYGKGIDISLNRSNGEEYILKERKIDNDHAKHMKTEKEAFDRLNTLLKQYNIEADKLKPKTKEPKVVEPPKQGLDEPSVPTTISGKDSEVPASQKSWWGSLTESLSNVASNIKTAVSYASTAASGAATVAGKTWEYTASIRQRIAQQTLGFFSGIGGNYISSGYSALNEFIYEYTSNRDADKLKAEIEKKVNNNIHPNKQGPILSQLRDWYSQAKVVDDYEHIKAKALDEQMIQLFSESTYYNRLFGNEMSGIYAPNEKEIWYNFFADDKEKLKASFVKTPEFHVERTYLNIQSEVELAVEMDKK